MLGWNTKVYTGGCMKYITFLVIVHCGVRLRSKPHILVIITNNVSTIKLLFQATDESEASREDVEKKLRATDRQ